MSVSQESEHRAFGSGFRVLTILDVRCMFMTLYRTMVRVDTNEVVGRVRVASNHSIAVVAGDLHVCLIGCRAIVLAGLSGWSGCPGTTYYHGAEQKKFGFGPIESKGNSR